MESNLSKNLKKGTLKQSIATLNKLLDKLDVKYLSSVEDLLYMEQDEAYKKELHEPAEADFS
ncbi:hypothetical protein HZC21_01575 [Candidatus Peregrinibacteria bacterium]|nr:hypothetical protein [Candidatus Peregrinibacteria bacterium]